MAWDGDEMSWMMALLTIGLADLMGRNLLVWLRNCTDITHANYFGLFSMQRHDDDDDDPLLSSVCADFIRNSKIISDHSYIRQISLMLLMRPQKQGSRQAGRGKAWASVSATITFCSGPVAANGRKIRLRPQNMNFISAMQPGGPFV